MKKFYLVFTFILQVFFFVVPQNLEAQPPTQNVPIQASTAPANFHFLAAEGGLPMRSDATDPALARLYAPGGPYAKFDPNKEVLSRRGENVKFFMTSNDSGKYMVKSGVSHYWENGGWRTISNEITPFRSSQYPLATVHNATKTYYGATISDGIVMHKPDGAAINGFAPKAIIALDATGNILGTINTVNSGASVGPVTGDENNVIHYNNVFPSTQMEVKKGISTMKTAYTIDQNVFNNLPSALSQAANVALVEKMTIPAGATVEPVYASNHTTVLGYAVMKDGQMLFGYQNARYYDNTLRGGRHRIRRANLDYTLSGNELEFRVEVPLQWLKDTAQFPVTIDPTITILAFDQTFSTGSITDDGCQRLYDWEKEILFGWISWDWGGGDPSDIYVGFADLDVFDINAGDLAFNGYAKFNLTSIPATCFTSAELQMYQLDWQTGNYSQNLQFQIGWANWDPWSSNTCALYNATYDLSEVYTYHTAYNVVSNSPPNYYYNHSPNNAWHHWNGGNTGFGMNVSLLLRDRITARNGSYMTIGISPRKPDGSEGYYDNQGCDGWDCNPANCVVLGDCDCGNPNACEDQRVWLGWRGTNSVAFGPYMELGSNDPPGAYPSNAIDIPLSYFPCGTTYTAPAVDNSPDQCYTNDAWDISHDVWYHITIPAGTTNVPLRVSTCDKDNLQPFYIYNSLLHVYSPLPAPNGTRLAFNDDWYGTWTPTHTGCSGNSIWNNLSYLEVNLPGSASVATEYYIVIEGSGGYAGIMNLNISLAPSSLGSATPPAELHFCGTNPLADFQQYHYYSSAPTISLVNPVGSSRVWEYGSNFGGGTFYSSPSCATGLTSCSSKFPPYVNNTTSSRNYDRVRITVQSGTCPSVSATTMLYNHYNNPPTGPLQGIVDDTVCQTGFYLTATFPDSINMLGRVEFIRSTNASPQSSCTPFVLEDWKQNTCVGCTTITSSLITPPAAGTYYYYVRYNPNYPSSYAGCNATSCGPASKVTVVPPPDPPTTGGSTFSPTTNSTVCGGNTITILTMNGGNYGVNCSLEWQYSTNAVMSNASAGGAGASSITVGTGLAITSGMSVHGTGLPTGLTVGTYTSGTGVVTLVGGVTTASVVGNTMTFGTWSSSFTYPATSTFVAGSTAGLNALRARRTNCGSSCATSLWGTAGYWTVIAAPVVATTGVASPNLAQVCLGSTLTLLPGATGTGGSACQITYQYSTSGSGGPWTNTGTTIPSITPASANTYIIQARYGDCSASSGCPNTAWVTCATWTVVADPTSPTATKSPTDAAVCGGTTLSLTNVTGGNLGAGCSVLYSYSTDNGASFISNGTTLPSFSAVYSTAQSPWYNYIRVWRGNCTSGASCTDPTTYNEYSWQVTAGPTFGNIVADPFPVANACAGTNLQLLTATVDPESSYGCALEYQLSSNGGGSYSAHTVSGFPHTVVSSAGAGHYILQVRRNNCTSCSGVGAQAYQTIADWIVTSTPVGATPGNPIEIDFDALNCAVYYDTVNNSTNYCYADDGIAGTNDQTTDDIWYRFVLSSTATVNISTCGSGINSYIHLVNSANTSELAVNDDAGSPCNVGAGESYYQAVNLAAGTYYAVIETKTGTGSGPIYVAIGLDIPVGTGLSGNPTVCYYNGSYGSVNYTISSPNSTYPFIWEYQDVVVSNSGNNTNYTVNFGASGTSDTVVVKKSFYTGCEVEIGRAPIAIYNLPFTLSGGNCSGGTAITDLTLSGSEVGIDYQLLLGGSNVGSPIAGTGSAISFPAQTGPGNYTVRGTSSTDAGCNHTLFGTVASTWPTAYTLSMNPSGGYICSGSTSTLSLSGSQAGYTYQLVGTTQGLVDAVVGTGSSFSFTGQGVADIYTAYAINPTTGCKTTMTNTRTVNVESMPVLTIPVAPQPGICSTDIVVSIGSVGVPTVSGVIYDLYRSTNNGVSYTFISGQSITGDGTGPKSYTSQPTDGIYKILAKSANLACTAYLNDSTELTTTLLTTRAAKVVLSTTITASTTSSITVANTSGITIGMLATATGVTASSFVTGVNITTKVITLNTTGTTATSGTVTFRGSISEICAGSPVEIHLTSNTSAWADVNGSANVMYTLRDSANGITIGSIHGGTGSTAINWTGVTPAANSDYYIYADGGNCTTAYGSSGSTGTVQTRTATGGTGGAFTHTMASTTNTTILPGMIVTGTNIGTNAWVRSATSTTITTSVANSAGISNPTTITYTPVGAKVTLLSPTVQTITPTTPAGYCSGDLVDIGLSAVQGGTNYRLYKDGTDLGYGDESTTNPSDWLDEAAAGVYTVKATTTTTGCTADMSDSVVIKPAATVQTVGGDDVCFGATSTITLSDSEIDFNYQLLRDNVYVSGAVIAGDGSALSFGTQTDAGVYTVVALDAVNVSATGSISTNTVSVASTKGILRGMDVTGTGIGTNATVTGVSLTTVTLSVNNSAAVSGTITFSNGCATTMTGDVTIKDLATYTLSVTETSALYDNDSIVCNGDNFTIHLSDSEPDAGTDVIYKLYKDGVLVTTPTSGAPLSGTGSALAWVRSGEGGEYTIKATWAATSATCEADMDNGIVVTNVPIPAAVSVTCPGCAGTNCASVTLQATGGTPGRIFFQGTTDNGELYDSAAISYTVYATGTSTTYYFRSELLGCWGPDDDYVVTVYETPETPVITDQSLPLTTVTASSSAGVATLTFAAQASVPYAAGTKIIVSGVVPAGFNGTYAVLASPAPTTSSVSYTNSTAGPQTVAGTISKPICSSDVLTATYPGSGTIYYQGITFSGTSTASGGASPYTYPTPITQTNTYYFRANENGCWSDNANFRVTVTTLATNTQLNDCMNVNETASRDLGYLFVAPTGGTRPYTFTPPSGAVQMVNFGDTVRIYEVEKPVPGSGSANVTFSITDFKGCVAPKVVSIPDGHPQHVAHESSSGNTSVACYSVGYNKLLTFVDPGAPTTNAILSINDNGQDLGAVIVTVYKDASEPAVALTGSCSGANQLALMRHFVVSPEKQPAAGNPTTVQLYFTDDELSSLITATAANNTGSNPFCEGVDDVTAITSLYVTKYDGSNEDGSYSNNNPSGLYRLYDQALPGGSPNHLSAASNGFASIFDGANLPNKHYLQLNAAELSEFWIHGSSVGAVLPVQMLYLEAHAVNNAFIQVNWATASEINNDGFWVERSTDGQTWTQLDWVNGKGDANGNSTVQLDYTYNDIQVVPDVRYYYRLQQVDNDADYDYTDVVSAIIRGQVSFSVKDFVPNPTMDKTSLVIVATKDQEIKVEFFDIIGQRVMGGVYQLNHGGNRLEFSMETLASGTYTAIVSSANEIYAKKIVLTR